MNFILQSSCILSAMTTISKQRNAIITLLMVFLVATVYGQHKFRDDNAIYLPVALRTRAVKDIHALNIDENPTANITEYSAHCSKRDDTYRSHRNPTNRIGDVNTWDENCVLTLNEIETTGKAKLKEECDLTIKCSEFAGTPEEGTPEEGKLDELCPIDKISFNGNQDNVNGVMNPACKSSLKRDAGAVDAAPEILLQKRWRHTAASVSKYFKVSNHTDGGGNLQLNTKAIFYQDISTFSNTDEYTGQTSELRNETTATRDRFMKTGKKTKDCGMGCENGKIFKFSPKKDKTFFGDMFVKPDCAWIDICFDVNYDNMTSPATLNCNADKKLKLHLKHNFAVATWSKPGIPIRFFRKNEKFTRISFARTLDGVIAVTSGVGERALFQSYHLKTDKPEVGITFSSDACLMEGYGMRMSSTITAIAHLNEQGVEQTLETVTVEQFKDPEGFEQQEVVEQNVAAEGGQYVQPVDIVYAPLSTTPKPDVNFGNMAGRVYNKPDDADVQKEGYATWGIFFGFMLGSTIGFLLMGLMFYLCRRTIYADWYRGMFKRYNCDASGTTGGVTGSDFGKTTMGGTNASQMSTIAATDMGTTGSGTTAGGTTTGGMDTTGGGGATTGGATTGGDTVAQ